MSSNSLFRCSEHAPGQPVCLSVPSIHMDNQTCLCSFNTKHSLFVWLTAFCLSSSSSPHCSSTSSLTCSDTAGFLQTFRFSLFAFWWGDTRHMVESSHRRGTTNRGEVVRETWRGQGSAVQAGRDGGWDKGKWKWEIVIKRNKMKGSLRETDGTKCDGNLN